MLASRRHTTSRLFATLCAATFLTPLAAQAEEAAPAAADAPGLGDIVVTATRKSESLQKVAISLQALSPDKLSQQHVSGFADFANMLPSVSFSSEGPGRSEPYFRGIAVGGGQAATVGVYLDDIPITTAGKMPEVHVYDVERVEALSGPQGTLFGSSSLAGTLRIITAKAKIGKFEAGYDLDLNKFGKGQPGGSAEGFVNIPVSDALAIRLVGYYQHDGGYIDNTPGTYNYQSVNYTLTNKDMVAKDFNWADQYGGRATALIKLGDNWTVTPSFTYQYLDARGPFNYDPRVGDLAVHDYSQTYNKDSWYQASLTIQGKIGDFDVVSATGYFHRKIRNANDYTYYSVTYDGLVASGQAGSEYTNFTDSKGNTLNPTQSYYGERRQRKFTQELRVSVPKSWPFALTLGGFYQFQKNSTDDNYYIPGLSTATNSLGYSPALASINMRDAYYLVETDTHFKDGALFAEGNYELVHNVKLTGGLRYFIADNGTYGFNGTQGTAQAMGCWDDAAIYNKFIHPTRLSCISTAPKFHQTGETHKLSLSWQVTPAKMVYATYSTGFRPGGGNVLAGAAPYKADTLSNFELGFKTTWGRNFRINGAFYYEQWKGVQYEVVPIGFQGQGVTLNAGDARVFGVELDTEWRPVTGLTLSASGAYNDAALSSNFCSLDPATRVTQYTSCSAPDTIAAAKGTRLPRQPRLKLQSSARYEFGLAGKDAFVQGTLFYQTSSTSDLDTQNNIWLGNTSGFASFDFSAGVKVHGVSLEAYIQNAFDQRGILSKNTFCNIQYCHDSSRSYPIKPQIFGIKASQRF